jgi:hypothetical protein
MIERETIKILWIFIVGKEKKEKERKQKIQQ